MTRVTRFAPKKHITQVERLTRLRSLLVMTASWPPDPESLVRSYGLPIDVVRVEVAAEDMRRRARA